MNSNKTLETTSKLEGNINKSREEKRKIYKNQKNPPKTKMTISTYLSIITLQDF